MKTLLPVTMFFLSLPAFAAYPPFAASALYIRTILETKEVVEQLGIENPIESIQRNGNAYTVTAGLCSLEVTVRHEDTSGPIPPSTVPKFRLEIGVKHCLNNTFSMATFAIGADLGQEMPVKVVDGAAKFGAAYTYGSDPDGPAYLLTFTPDIAASALNKTYRWNVYLESTKEFLLDWSSDRTFKMWTLLQVKINDSYGDKKNLIQTILNEQAKPKDKGQLYFVLADENDLPQFFIKISDLCRLYPKNFKDVSYGASCDQPHEIP
jgi:hypothetical protein